MNTDDITAWMKANKYVVIAGGGVAIAISYALAQRLFGGGDTKGDTLPASGMMDWSQIASPSGATLTVRNPSGFGLPDEYLDAITDSFDRLHDEIVGLNDRLQDVPQTAPTPVAPVTNNYYYQGAPEAITTEMVTSTNDTPPAVAPVAPVSSVRASVAETIDRLTSIIASNPEGAAYVDTQRKAATVALPKDATYMYGSGDRAMYIRPDGTYVRGDGSTFDGKKGRAGDNVKSKKAA